MNCKSVWIPGAIWVGTLKWGELQWDAAMNTAYTAVMKLLPARQKGLLQASQREWIRYRDREFAFMNDLLYHDQKVSPSAGIPVIMAMHSDRVALVKNRAQVLRAYQKMPYRFGE